MFKPSTRTRSFTSARPHPVPGFAETQFLHAEEDEDYSGFAPTQMFEDEAPAPSKAERRSVRRDVDGVDAEPPAEESAMPASWVTARWVEAQEAKAHEAAHQARALIAAQRRGESRLRIVPPAAEADRPAGWMHRFRKALQRVLPVDFYSVLPLFICVSLTMALISAVLPMFDKP
jgi:hypothetical protein